MIIVNVTKIEAWACSIQALIYCYLYPRGKFAKTKKKNRKYRIYNIKKISKIRN